MESIDEKIARVRERIAEVKKRRPFHSPKVALFQELEELELELEALKKLKKKHEAQTRPEGKNR